MTAKEYLSQVGKMDSRLRLIGQKVERLRSVLEYRSPSLEGAGGGGNADRLPDTVALIVEYEQQAEKLREEYIGKFREIDRAIAAVPDAVLREVLERRYLFYQRWEQIAEEMNYSERHVLRLHGAALQQVKMSLNVTLDV